MLTMLGAIRTSQGGIADKVSCYIIEELRKRVTFGDFSEDRMKLLRESMWNKVEYDLEDSRKVTGQLENCSDSKGMQIVLNGRTFKYYF